MANKKNITIPIELLEKEIAFHSFHKHHGEEYAIRCLCEKLGIVPNQENIIRHKNGLRKDYKDVTPYCKYCSEKHSFLDCKA